ncbi:hypothetical protein QFC21_006781 [Naganishia friedmannii]|uniref:Uncharacterized protein n=1 Tax=Naganishia friedmannii TaxID=89922 RepID=A0ACC2V0T5_9TREE|nr:hypothetical protein QFC21_006781 [Naganishia friedmannii]
MDAVDPEVSMEATTLNSALGQEATALEQAVDPALHNEESEMQLDPELHQLGEEDNREDPSFYDPSVEQAGPSSYILGSDIDNGPSAHITHNINDMAAPTPLATVSEEHAAAMVENEHEKYHQHHNNNNNINDEEDEDQDNKRRRVQRACDACRRKKIRCDGAAAGKRNVTCSNCIESKVACTYVESAKRRGPPPGYTEALEWKISRFEDLLARVQPDLDLTREVGPPINRDEFHMNTFKQQLNSLGIDSQHVDGRARSVKAANPSSERSTSRKGKNPPMNLTNRSTTLANALDPPSFPAHSQAEVDAVMGLLGQGAHEDPRLAAENRMRKVFTSNVISDDGRLLMSRPESPNSHAAEHTIDHRARSQSIHDPAQSAISSGGGIGNEDQNSNSTNLQAKIKHADAVEAQENEEFQLGAIQNNLAEEGYRFHGKSSGMQLLRTVVDYRYAAEDGGDDATQQQAGKVFAVNISQNRRTAYWAIPMWEAVVSESKTEPLDLTRWPEPDLAQRLIDAYFETDNLVLPLLNRVLFQKAFDRGVWKTNHRFAKVCLMLFASAAKSVDDPRVYWYAGEPTKEKEAYKNPELYKHSAGWRWVEPVLKAGKSWLSVTSLEDLQIFVDIGIHTKAGYSRIQDRAEKELLKRAFWCLIYIDSYSSAAMGRSLQMNAEDYDVDYPLEVDDEYWDTGDSATDFVQPVDKPCKISMFVCLLRLVNIIGRAMKMIYPVNREASGKDNDPKAQERMIAGLDSSLFSWLDSVPEQLRWDPQREDNVFFEQSCVLYSYYYFAQILIHRPFIPTPKTAPAIASLALPSLAICTNAARSCAHIVELQVSRLMPNYHVLLPAFTSAIVLLVNVWASKKTGRTQESETNLREVRKCLHALRDAEPAWRGAGRMRDILMELGSISDTSLQTPTSNRASTPTPSRTTTSGLPASSLRKEVPPAKESASEQDIHNQETIKPELREKQGHPTLGQAGDVFGSRGTRSGATVMQSIPCTNPGNESTNSHPQTWPLQQSHTPAQPGLSLLSNDGMHAPYADPTAQPWRELQTSNAGLAAVSPRTYHALFGNGVYPVENIVNRASAARIQPLGPSLGNDGFVGDASSSNAAMLNGMYSLLSGNIYNLQLPEYQQWLHTVAQNQQLVANLTSGPPTAAHMSQMGVSSEQPLAGALNNGIMDLSTFNENGMPNLLPWDNMSLGVDLAAAPDVNGAMADIWSMAPNNFEMDEWSRYLSDAQPPQSGTAPPTQRRPQ